MKSKRINECYDTGKCCIDEPQDVSCAERKRIAADFIATGFRTARKHKGGCVVIKSVLAYSSEK